MWAQQYDHFALFQKKSDDNKWIGTKPSEMGLKSIFNINWFTFSTSQHPIFFNLDLLWKQIDTQIQDKNKKKTSEIFPQ